LTPPPKLHAKNFGTFFLAFSALLVHIFLGIVDQIWIACEEKYTEGTMCGTFYFTKFIEMSLK
jgi:hypothetical protein